MYENKFGKVQIYFGGVAYTDNSEDGMNDFNDGDDIRTRMMVKQKMMMTRPGRRKRMIG